MKRLKKIPTFRKNPSSNSKWQHLGTWCFLLFLFSFSATGIAQQATSLEEVIKEGLKNNFDIRIAGNQQAIVKKDVSRGNAGFLPEISAYASYDQAFLDAKVKVVSGSEMETDNAVSKLTTAGISLKWTLFDGTAMMLKYDKLKNLNKAEEIALKDRIEKTVSSITLVYCDIIRQEKLLAAYKKRLEVSNFRMNIARQRKDIGSGSEYEFLQASVNRQGDTASLLTQTTQVKNSMTRLNELLACDLYRSYSLPDSFPLLPIPDLQTLLRNARETNNKLLASQLKVDLQALETKTLKAKRSPYLVLRSSYGLYENETEASFIKFNRNLGPQVGLTAGISLFDGLNLNRNINKSNLLLDNSKIEYQQEQQTLQADLICKYNEYGSQIQVVKLNSEGLLLADKNMKIASDAYQVGMLSSLQLREAQDQLFQAAASLIQAQYQLKINETELLRLCGMLVY